MKRIFSPLAILLYGFPALAFAGDTNAGFFVLGTMFCIPSLGLFILCSILLWQQTKRLKPNYFVVGLLPLAYIPLAITVTNGDVPLPLPLFLVIQQQALEKFSLWPVFISVVFLYFAYAVPRSIFIDFKPTD